MTSTLESAVCSNLLDLLDHRLLPSLTLQEAQSVLTLYTRTITGQPGRGALQDAPLDEVSAVTQFAAATLNKRGQLPDDVRQRLASLLNGSLWRQFK